MNWRELYKSRRAFRANAIGFSLSASAKTVYKFPQGFKWISGVICYKSSDISAGEQFWLLYMWASFRLRISTRK